MLVLAKRDEAFRAMLNEADLNVPDGFGVVLCAPALRRHTGVDLLALLCQLAQQEGKRVLLFGGKPGVAARAARRLETLYPSISIRGVSGGLIAFQKIPDEKMIRWHQDATLIRLLQDLAPDILVVALGHGKQERWVRDHLPLLPSVKIAIGVGGALDYLSGAIPRAPKWMRRAGLEWLFRLLRDPKRWKRISTAVLVFPLLVVCDRIRNKDRL
jgi:N-acetylglucosaminyldiphosphoundecaprenol N-acetyl-beta-D-mannosaminyltransferase